jgi:predicted CXXCH cytochrome family protein
MPSPSARAQAVLTIAGVLALAACCICWVLFTSPRTLAQDAPQAPAALNPHWSKDGCGQCHGADSPPARIPLAKVDALCLRCHDGKSAVNEIHPIGRAVNAKVMDFPKGWPLNEARLTCATCHDVIMACKADATRPDENSAMLRKPPQSKAFCLSCHREEQFPKFNPHLMLTAERKVVEEKCLACHKPVPDRDLATPTGKADLVTEQFALCKSCHPHHEDQFNPGHIGAKVKPEMLAFMRARESVGLAAAAPSKELIAKLKAEGARPTLLRPDAQNTLRCTTCHNPHPAGLFKPGTPAAFGAMRVVGGGRVVTPARNEHFCSNCHSDI